MINLTKIKFLVLVLVLFKLTNAFEIKKKIVFIADLNVPQLNFSYSHTRWRYILRNARSGIFRVFWLSHDFNQLTYSYPVTLERSTIILTVTLFRNSLYFYLIEGNLQLNTSGWVNSGWFRHRETKPVSRRLINLMMSLTTKTTCQPTGSLPFLIWK